MTRILTDKKIRIGPARSRPAAEGPATGGPAAVGWPRAGGRHLAQTPNPTKTSNPAEHEAVEDAGAEKEGPGEILCQIGE